MVQKKWVLDNLAALIATNNGIGSDQFSGALGVICTSTSTFATNPAGITIPYNDPTIFPNGGQGIFKDVSGNELPNTPHFTTSLGAQYAMPVNATWTALVRTDFYYQSELVGAHLQ